MEFPRFKYHPEPTKTGSIVPSTQVCPVCGESRGFAYSGIPYGVKEVEHICPWCIATGLAHERFGVEFTDIAGVGGYGQWEKVPQEVAEEVAFRTPGFAGCQQERWFTHCGDAAEFLGPMSKAELERMGPEAIEAVLRGCEQEGVNWGFFSKLAQRHKATAYLFRCHRCGQLGGYFDFD